MKLFTKILNFNFIDILVSKSKLKNENYVITVLVRELHIT